MDYLNGLPVDYPKWTTLKFMIKRNSDFELNFNSASYNPNEDAVDLIKHTTNTCNTVAISLKQFLPLQLVLSFSRNNGKQTSGSSGWIRTSFPVAAYVFVIKYTIPWHECKFSPYHLAGFPCYERLLRLRDPPFLVSGRNSRWRVLNRLVSGHRVSRTRQQKEKIVRI